MILHAGRDEGEGREKALIAEVTDAFIWEPVRALVFGEKTTIPDEAQDAGGFRGKHRITTFQKICTL